MKNGLIFLSLVLLSGWSGSPATGSVTHEPPPTVAGVSLPQTTEPVAAPDLVASPAALEFGKNPVKSTSAPQFVTVTNAGKAELIIKVVREAPDFDLVDNCSGRLAVGSSCEIGARFAPPEAGIHKGNVKLVIDSQTALSIPLSGNAVISPVTLSETYLIFRTAMVGTTSLPQGVLLTNHSDTAALTIANIAVPPDFRIAPVQSQCSSGGVVAPLASCSLNVLFVPTKMGALDEQVTITASDSASPHVVALQGIATAIKVSSPSLRWGPVAIGALGESQNFEVNNVGTARVEIAAIQVKGDFSQQNTCGKELLPQQSCSITVRFEPKAAGKRTGEVVIRDSDPTRRQNVFLIGAGAEAGRPSQPRSPIP